MIFAPGDEAIIEDFILELKRKDPLKTRAIDKYGFGAILRSFYGLPSTTPLNLKSQHGVCLWNEIPPSELQAKQKIMLVFSRRWLDIWKQVKSGKLVVGLPNPFLLYKRKFKICQLPTAAGCVFFYAHSTSHELGETDNASVIRVLRNLPPDFGECLISMHYVDMLRGEYKSFLDAGFKVFCAGHYSDREFVARFYGMISEKKYALSNSIGSHYFYCIEHGLPFSYIGFSPKYRNLGYVSDVWRAVERARQHVAYTHRLEEGFVRDISDRQLEYVKEELGSDLFVPRYKFVLITAFALFLDFSSAGIKKLEKSLQPAKKFLSSRFK